MKIAYVYDAVYPWIKGGAEKRVHELSKRLAKRGHDVHCYGIKWWEGQSTILCDGVYLHGICQPMELYSGKRRSMVEAITFAWKVLLSLKGNYDLIDCQNFPYLSCFSAKMTAITNRAELFITWHEVWRDYWYEYLGARGFLGRSIEDVVSKLAHNIAVSERTKRELESMGAAEVQLVPNGIDFKVIDRIPSSEKISDIVYAGRLIPHKNIDLLIKAVALVKRDCPDIKAVLIGDGPEASRLKHMAKDLNLNGNIEFIGFRESYEELISRLKASKVFISPSIREGFGLAALEAHACGLPVITVDHRLNAVCDLITDRTGQICSFSEMDLAEAIMHSLNNCDYMRQACIDLATGYDWNRICTQLEQIYIKGTE